MLAGYLLAEALPCDFLGLSGALHIGDHHLHVLMPICDFCFLDSLVSLDIRPHRLGFALRQGRRIVEMHLVAAEDSVELRVVAAVSEEVGVYQTFVVVVRFLRCFDACCLFGAVV